MKFSKAKPKQDGTTHPVDIAIPAFGYKSHISVDRRHKIIRRQKVTDAAAADGARLREGLIDPNNTAGDVWGDSAYRSQANEAYLDKYGRTSRIHQRKPPGRPMPEAMRQANGRKSKVRSRVEHVFAEQKHRMGLFVRTIGIGQSRGRHHVCQHGLQHEAMVLVGTKPKSSMKAQAEKAEITDNAAFMSPVSHEHGHDLPEITSNHAVSGGLHVAAQLFRALWYRRRVLSAWPACAFRNIHASRAGLLSARIMLSRSQGVVLLAGTVRRAS